MKNPAYLDALKMLARRELSESQVRQRLARREHATEDIDAAVERLKEARALDDLRVAGAIARTQVSIKRRGRLRVLRQIEAAGIDRVVARTAVDEVFRDVDDTSLIEAALEKRLHGRPTVADDREYQRLFRFLIGQGFEPDRIARALASRRSRQPD